jgi:Lon protease-like protein
MTELNSIPLFPLNTVLFPGGHLALRIFEARYLDMVSECLRSDSGFGVCLIREGSEVGQARIHGIGTLARITNWDRLDDGLLGLTVLGERRFEVLETKTRPDRLLVGRVRYADDQVPVQVPNELVPVASLLEEVLTQIGEAPASVPRRLGEAGWVADRMAELLPLDLADKQRLLETGDAVDRLVAVGDLLLRLGGG